ncbi:MAG: CRISPR-associated protein Cas4 [Desulfurococcus sp.]|nr:CRISPR-associated protein Cas4 [Desulfurococcus sp.]
MHVASTLVTEILYRRVMKEQLEKLEESRRKDVVYVTELVSCSHKYHLRRKYPELTLGFEPSAVLGTLLHLGLESILREEGYEVEYSVERQVEVEGAFYTVKGRVDAFNPSRGVVVEVKSSRSSRELPRQHHIEQLNIYLNLLEAEKGILVYITPDKIEEYEVLKERIDVGDLLKNTINDLIHPRYSWECNYCAFKRICPYSTEAR